MNPRTLLVVGLLLTPSAWSQESVPVAPEASRPTFDLSAAAVKKIVRDTAATQYAATPPQSLKSESAESKAFEIVLPEAPPKKQAAKLNLPPMPAPIADNGFFSALIDTLIDEALDNKPDDPVELNTIGWLTCQSAIDLKRETLGNRSCKD